MPRLLLPYSFSAGWTQDWKRCHQSTWRIPQVNGFLPIVVIMGRGRWRGGILRKKKLFQQRGRERNKRGTGWGTAAHTLSLFEWQLSVPQGRHSEEEKPASSTSHRYVSLYTHTHTRSYTCISLPHQDAVYMYVYFILALLSLSLSLFPIGLPSLLILHLLRFVCIFIFHFFTVSNERSFPHRLATAASLGVCALFSHSLTLGSHLGSPLFPSPTSFFSLPPSTIFYFLFFYDISSLFSLSLSL